MSTGETALVVVLLLLAFSGWSFVVYLYRLLGFAKESYLRLLEDPGFGLARTRVAKVHEAIVPLRYEVQIADWGDAASEPAMRWRFTIFDADAGVRVALGLIYTEEDLMPLMLGNRPSRAEALHDAFDWVYKQAPASLVTSVVVQP